MKTIQTHTVELKGSRYDIGYRLGTHTASIPPLRQCHTSGFPGFGKDDIVQATAMFDRWCPGLTEELTGFADALRTSPETILYYAMTYLRPNCSQLALLPSKTRSGHPLLARNYEFNHEAEDFTLMKTSANGTYTHMGTSVLHFGREDGVNEHGLAITMSSCGFPVGPTKHMRKPAIKGLQYWAVIRTLFEQCKDVEDALACLQGMPIAYNLNMIMMDRAGRAVLVETLDGRTASKAIDPDTKDQYLHATNHPHLPELAIYEPNIMKHSLVRYQSIRQMAESSSSITADDVKKLLLAPYPDGLCCHYYEDFFGTTKSMIIDPIDGTIELCWGGRVENGWNRYAITDPLQEETRDIQISLEQAAPEIFAWIAGS